MATRHDSRYTVDIPPVDLATFIFSSGDREQRRRPQFFDADCPARCFSLDQAEILVKRLSKGLQDLGLGKNDKVLLYSGNSLYFPILYWGTVAAGISELSYQLKDSDAKLIITSAAGVQTALEAAAQVGIPRHRVFEFADPLDKRTQSGLPSWTDIWATEQQSATWTWKRISSAKEAQETTVAINYSSGTTGTPKGVEISHQNVIANSLQVIFKRNMVADTTRARERKARIDLSGERWLAPLPMFHAYGQMYYCVTAARMGVKVFIMMQYSIERYLLFLDIYRITFLTGVPTLMVALSKHPNATAYNLKAIESVVTGSAPLNPEIGRLVEKTHLRSGVQVKQGWGLTETTCSATGFAQDDEDDGRSIGWLNPNVSAKIVPVPEHGFEQSTEIPYTVGEIWIAGPNVMKGYYKRPRETMETIVYDDDGTRWLKTGDVGYIDNRGCLYIVDRLKVGLRTPTCDWYSDSNTDQKELIKVKGLQVAPAEIEQVLLTHQGIADAAVVGEKRRDGEYPKAFVVRTPGSTVTAKEVQDYIEARLSKHKWLTAGVHFIEVIPRTPSGKVMRRLLQKSKTDTAKSSAKL
ncbi:4-coumarate--CoA ligase-like 7 [Fonsecaea pedrosoi]|nr:4-coumarate--CoA ligase-like 7 [Fonsecaea pedrosoi]